ncbi:MAG: SAM-dependent methyltransferase [Hyphomicrobiaceae bacterium]
MVKTAYLAPDGFLAELMAELGDTAQTVHGRLVLAGGPSRPIAWSANAWLEPVHLPIASIKDAARQLRAIQRNWMPYAFQHHRRTALIREALPHVSAKPLAFGDPAPSAPLGSFTLLEPNLMLASARCSSPFPNGEVQFVEDRSGPPNRAYLKLWEALTVIGTRPGPGDLCLDLGASPGGWTSVIAGLGARVVAVDKAPLDSRIAAMPGVVERRESAFGLEPQAIGPVDWLFSDVICYPQRLLSLIERWMDTGLARRFVCTVKFQGEADLDSVAAFKAIPGSQLMHLHHNKHELTWVKL